MKRPLIPHITRIMHAFSALFNVAYVYTPLHGWSGGLSVVQYMTMPLLLITGFLMVHGKKKARRFAEGVRG